MFRIDYPFKKAILACGAQTPGGFCLTKKNCAYVVNDFGCLDEQACLQHYQNEIQRLQKELKIKPKLVTHDLHPEYSSTKYAQSLGQQGKGLNCLAIQHHHAHLASCWAENRLNNCVIGVVLDGTGYGEDATLWGAACFVGDVQGFRRVGHLRPVSMPGQGKRIIADAWQKAASYLNQAFGENFTDLEIDFVRRRPQEEWMAFKQNLHAPVYSSAASGLFDAVSALVGLREHVEYEGQGVTELERIANRSSHVASKIYQIVIKREQDKFLFDPEPIFRNIVEDLKKNVSKSIISAAFHNTIIEIVRQLCQKIRQKEKVKDVILTGTVLQNKFLFNQLKGILTQDGFNLIGHKHFSCNDNSISFGQAVLADAR